MVEALPPRPARQVPPGRDGSRSRTAAVNAAVAISAIAADELAGDRDLMVGNGNAHVSGADSDRGSATARASASCPPPPPKLCSGAAQHCPCLT
jgi:hypothetical protein